MFVEEFATLRLWRCFTQTMLDGTRDVQGGGIEQRHLRAIRLPDQQLKFRASEDDPFGPGTEKVIDHPEICLS